LAAIDDPAELGVVLAENAGAWRDVLSDIDTSAIEVFGRVEAMAIVWSALQRRWLTRFGLNYAELSMLCLLRTAGPERRCSLATLRERVGQSSAGVTRIVDKGVDAGWVERSGESGDRRRVELCLTEAGATLAESVLRSLLAEQNALLSHVESSDRAGLVAGLDALLWAFGDRFS
jgi:DNA-binding MarR family transcriptional regulator